MTRSLFPIVVFSLSLASCQRHSHDSEAKSTRTKQSSTSWPEFANQHWAEFHSFQVIHRGDTKFVDLSENGKDLLREVLKSAVYKPTRSDGRMVQPTLPPTWFHLQTLGGSSLSLNLAAERMTIEFDTYDVNSTVAQQLLDEVDKTRKSGVIGAGQ